MMKQSCSDEFQRDYLTRHVLNLDVTFHWVVGSDRFWFKCQTRAGDEYVLVDVVAGEQSRVSDITSLRSEPHRADRVRSPDERLEVLRRGSNLWLRDLVTGDERCLTHDGEPNFAYGTDPRSDDGHKVARRRSGAEVPLDGVLWSSNSRFI